MGIVQILRRLFEKKDAAGVTRPLDESRPLRTGGAVAGNTVQLASPAIAVINLESSLAFRTPADVREEFCGHPRRALVLTTVDHESRAVKAHLLDSAILIGDKGGFYEYGRFSDPAGDWLVVHVITSQGNSDAGLAASKSFDEFGDFDVVMFVGVAGSLKDDIPIGSVVVGDYVYNGHSAKVADTETLIRPHGLPAPLALLNAARALIYMRKWTELIRAPVGMEMPSSMAYPCAFPPSAFIKGIVSGEEVVAGDKSSRYALLRTHFNDAGAVEMEGWGVMNAAHHQSASAIIVRGISDMCAGKDHTKDNLHQPLAAAHAAAFAFGVLSFRSRAPGAKRSQIGRHPAPDGSATYVPNDLSAAEARTEFVFNFEGSKEDWSQEKIEAVVQRLREVTGDETLTLVRVEVGSVRLVVQVRATRTPAIDLANLRKAASTTGAHLLGVIPLASMSETDEARKALVAASTDLLSWERTLPDGQWMERPERGTIETRFELGSSSTVLLGEAGSGKSALLSKVAFDLLARGATVFALKADFLSTEVRTEADLQRELQLPALPSELILRIAGLQPIYVLIDQLDALASQLDLRSGRLNVLLNLIRRIGGMSNVHLLLSARTFEFNHDVRLRAIDAESVALALPPWHEVKERLVGVGINADAWPQRAQEVVRSPQALKICVSLARSGRREPFSTYQAMLEQLWHDRISSAKDSEDLSKLASDLAGQMAEEEALWLAASRFDDRSSAVSRLEALGFVIRSDSGLSVAFSHQTVFEYVLARTFVRSAGLLSAYVLERQDSLFVRAKLWAALNYLRTAEVGSYERESLRIWRTADLRRHLRILLVDFLGQVQQPIAFELRCMTEILSSDELRIFGLKAIGSGDGWFIHLGSTAIARAMSGTPAEAGQAQRILSLNWTTNTEGVVRLIEDRWLPYVQSDSYSWGTISACPVWTNEVERIADVVLKRTAISIWYVEHVVMTLAVEQPDLALRVVRSKLDYLLVAARDNPEVPEANGEEEDTEGPSRPSRVRSNNLKALLEAAEWHDLPSLAEAAPAAFLKTCWSWYVSVFSEILTHRESEGSTYSYPGQYVLEIETATESSRSRLRDAPLISALQTAVERLAEVLPDAFLRWAHENSGVEVLAAQQLIARGYEVAAGHLASHSLDWLLGDHRRFQLGTVYGHRQTTTDLVVACAPHWSEAEIRRFEAAVTTYRPGVPEHLNEPERRKIFADLVRATKKDLLQAVGIDRLAPENRELVATEQRALGDRFDRSITIGAGGFIGPPMEAAAMAKAKDRDILRIFREIPDSSDWDHPKRYMRGGNIQLSRAFAEFAKAAPERAIRLIEQFEPLKQERGAAYALEAMADDAHNDGLVLEALLDLHARGFGAGEFTDSASRALEKIAQRGADLSNEVIDLLVGWLGRTSAPLEEEETNADARSPSRLKEEDLKDESLIWGHGGASILPSGNYNVLSALASTLLSKKEAGRDRYFEILNQHLAREQDVKIWKALLHRLSNAGGSTPQVVSDFLRRLFDRFPEVLPTREAVIFLAHAQRWDDQLVFGVIQEWEASNQAFLQRAYGELVGLVATTKSASNWAHVRDKILATGSSEAKIGLAHSAVNLMPEQNFRQSASETLTALLNRASKDLVAVVMDVFRVVDDPTLDPWILQVLRGLAQPSTDLSAAPSHFVVERLQALVPHEADLVAKLAGRLVDAWRVELSDVRTGTAIAAPQLTDLALTLHRLGGASRQHGVELFEAMIEIDAYGARDTLAEIDGRFGRQDFPARQRLPRRHRTPRQRRATG